jgi:hypothetical protein
MKLLIAVVRMSTGVYRASCPSRPGCTVEAATMKKARDGMVMAVGSCMRSLDAVLPSRINIVHATEVCNTKGV